MSNASFIWLQMKKNVRPQKLKPPVSKSIKSILCFNFRRDGLGCWLWTETDLILVDPHAGHCPELTSLQLAALQMNESYSTFPDLVKCPCRAAGAKN